jgi:hypothetical protein
MVVLLKMNDEEEQIEFEQRIRLHCRRRSIDADVLGQRCYTVEVMENA